MRSEGVDLGGNARLAELGKQSLAVAPQGIDAQKKRRPRIKGGKQGACLLLTEAAEKIADGRCRNRVKHRKMPHGVTPLGGRQKRTGIGGGTAEGSIEKGTLPPCAAERDRLRNGGVRGDIHVKKLIKAEPQGGAGMGVERGGAPTGQDPDMIVKRQPPLYGAVKEGDEKGAVARLHYREAVTVGEKVGKAVPGLVTEEERERAAAYRVSHADGRRRTPQ